VETRLGDLLHIQDDWELSDDQKLRRFVQELANLDNTEQWLAMEREVALCRSLRVISGELSDAFQRLVNRVSLDDQNAIYTLIDDILERERMLAEHISASLQRLAAMAHDAQSSPQARAAAWRAVSRQRQQLSAERRALIDAERRFLESL
jgi:hypothetical protein